MRLIDADALKEEIESLKVYVYGQRTGRKITDELLTEYRKSVIDRIDEQPTVNRWIPCSERYPENEEEVEITYKCGGKFYTARAFYEDGTMHTEDSMMSCLDWLSWSDWCEYCEETDDWIIPKGWLEYVSFGDTYTVIDREVIAWRPLTEAYKEDEE